MEEKLTAVHLLVRKQELTAGDEGGCKRSLAAQKAKCLKYIREKGIDESQAVFYTGRGDLLRDVKRDRVVRLVMNDIGRLPPPWRYGGRLVRSKDERTRDPVRGERGSG